MFPVVLLVRLRAWVRARSPGTVAFASGHWNHLYGTHSLGEKSEPLCLFTLLWAAITKGRIEAETDKGKERPWQGNRRGQQAEGRGARRERVRGWPAVWVEAGSTEKTQELYGACPRLLPVQPLSTSPWIQIWVLAIVLPKLGFQSIHLKNALTIFIPCGRLNSVPPPSPKKDILSP